MLAYSIDEGTSYIGPKVQTRFTSFISYTIRGCETNLKSFASYDASISYMTTYISASDGAFTSSLITKYKDNGPRRCQKIVFPYTGTEKGGSATTIGDNLRLHRYTLKAYTFSISNGNQTVYKNKLTGGEFETSGPLPRTLPYGTGDDTFSCRGNKYTYPLIWGEPVIQEVTITVGFQMSNKKTFVYTSTYSNTSITNLQTILSESKTIISVNCGGVTKAIVQTISPKLPDVTVDLNKYLESKGINVGCMSVNTQIAQSIVGFRNQCGDVNGALEPNFGKYKIFADNVNEILFYRINNSPRKGQKQATANIFKKLKFNQSAIVTNIEPYHVQMEIGSYDTNSIDNNYGRVGTRAVRKGDYQSYTSQTFISKDCIKTITKINTFDDSGTITIPVPCSLTTSFTIKNCGQTQTITQTTCQLPVYGDINFRYLDKVLDTKNNYPLGAFVGFSQLDFPFATRSAYRYSFKPSNGKRKYLINYNIDRCRIKQVGGNFKIRALGVAISNSTYDVISYGQEFSVNQAYFPKYSTHGLGVKKETAESLSDRYTSFSDFAEYQTVELIGWDGTFAAPPSFINWGAEYGDGVVSPINVSKYFKNIYLDKDTTFKILRDPFYKSAQLILGGYCGFRIFSSSIKPNILFPVVAPDLLIETNLTLSTVGTINCFLHNSILSQVEYSYSTTTKDIMNDKITIISTNTYGWRGDGENQKTVLQSFGLSDRYFNYNTMVRFINYFESNLINFGKYRDDGDGVMTRVLYPGEYLKVGNNIQTYIANNIQYFNALNDNNGRDVFFTTSLSAQGAINRNIDISSYPAVFLLNFLNYINLSNTINSYSYRT